MRDVPPSAHPHPSMLRPPWQATVAVETIPEEGLNTEIVADAPTRAALATLAGLRDLSYLAARFALRREGMRVRAVGSVEGQVTQSCIITLEPVTSTVREEIEAIFAPDAEAIAGLSGRHRPAAHESEAGREALRHDADAEDVPEPIHNGMVDLGALAAEYFILGINPYPRKPGVVFTPPVEPVVPEEHPFAALKALKASPQPSAKGPKSKPE